MCCLTFCTLLCRHCHEIAAFPCPCRCCGQCTSDPAGATTAKSCMTYTLFEETRLPLLKVDQRGQYLSQCRPCVCSLAVVYARIWKEAALDCAGRIPTATNYDICSPARCMSLGCMIFSNQAENPSMRLSQLKTQIRKDWQRSSENPQNS